MEQSIVKRRHFTDEEIKLANSVDILQLARRYGYETEKAGRQSIHLIHSGGIHVFTDNNRFYCFADDGGIKKGGAIDFVMRQERISFPDAVAKLLGVENAEYIRRGTASVQARERGPLTLPDKAENFKRAYWYLVSQRGIDAQIVSAFMNQKKVYQEAKFGNCVFVGYDKDGTAKYCSMRAARADSVFRQDAVNSDKSYPFSCEGTSDKVIVNEAPIDLMSHASLSKHYGKDWMEDHRISLGCMSDAALVRYLEEHPDIKRIVFALDNDYLARNKYGELQNWGQEAAERMCAKYTEMGYKCAVHKPHLKDFNQDLIEVRKGRTPEELDRQRESELKEDFEAHARDEPLSYVLTEPDDEMEIS